MSRVQDVFLKKYMWGIEAGDWRHVLERASSELPSYNNEREEVLKSLFEIGLFDEFVQQYNEHKDTLEGIINNFMNSAYITDLKYEIVNDNIEKFIVTGGSTGCVPYLSLTVFPRTKVSYDIDYDAIHDEYELTFTDTPYKSYVRPASILFVDNLNYKFSATQLIGDIERYITSVTHKLEQMSRKASKYPWEMEKAQHVKTQIENALNNPKVKIDVKFLNNDLYIVSDVKSKSGANLELPVSRLYTWSAAEQFIELIRNAVK